MPRVRNWDFSKTPSRPGAERIVLLVRLDASKVYKRATELVDGWACTPILPNLWKSRSSRGKYSVGPLTKGVWPTSAAIVGPVVLCGRCTKRRDWDGPNFANGDYPAAHLRNHGDTPKPQSDFVANSTRRPQNRASKSFIGPVRLRDCAVFVPQLPVAAAIVAFIATSPRLI